MELDGSKGGGDVQEKDGGADSKGLKQPAAGGKAGGWRSSGWRSSGRYRPAVPHALFIVIPLLPAGASATGGVLLYEHGFKPKLHYSMLPPFNLVFVKNPKELPFAFPRHSS